MIPVEILRDEELIRFSEAARLIPSRPAVTTVWRWATNGTRGVTLDSVKIGAVWYTSQEAIGRFLEALNEPAEPVRRPRTRREEKAAVARAERILKRAGV